MNETYREKRVAIPADISARLYIIKQRGRDSFWGNSSEHGCGWHPDYPKQAFSKSELAKEIQSMIAGGYFVDCEILELYCRN